MYIVIWDVFIVIYLATMMGVSIVPVLFIGSVKLSLWLSSLFFSALFINFRTIDLYLPIRQHPDTLKTARKSV
jgi:hypothetical protein